MILVFNANFMGSLNDMAGYGHLVQNNHVKLSMPADERRGVTQVLLTIHREQDI